MGAELYLLEPGAYRFQLLADDHTLHEARLVVSAPRTHVTFDLPPRKTCRLTLTRD
jgi:hypothetical protein